MASNVSQWDLEFMSTFGQKLAEGLESIQPATRKWIQSKFENPVYTCTGKGGVYEYLGVSIGAGTSRGKDAIVYRDVVTGQMYNRSSKDFNERMARICEGEDALVPN